MQHRHGGIQCSLCCHVVMRSWLGCGQRVSSHLDALQVAQDGLTDIANVLPAFVMAGGLQKVLLDFMAFTGLANAQYINFGTEINVRTCLLCRQRCIPGCAVVHF
jgi:hypothetical protein